VDVDVDVDAPAQWTATTVSDSEEVSRSLYSRPPRDASSTHSSNAQRRRSPSDCRFVRRAASKIRFHLWTMSPPAVFLQDDFKKPLKADVLLFDHRQR